MCAFFNNHLRHQTESIHGSTSGKAQTRRYAGAIKEYDATSSVICFMSAVSVFKEERELHFTTLLDPFLFTHCVCSASSPIEQERPVELQEQAPSRSMKIYYRKRKNILKYRMMTWTHCWCIICPWITLVRQQESRKERTPMAKGSVFTLLMKMSQECQLSLSEEKGMNGSSNSLTSSVSK